MKNGRVIAIGDIHGCYYTLLELLEKLSFDKYNDKIIFLGDYIDRGNNSAEVVEFIINLQKEMGKDRCICLMGNHEYMALNDESLWLYNGGKKTKKSYYRIGLYWKYHFWWFKTLPLFYELDNYIFCHAGLTYPVLSDNSLDDLIWGRDWINYKTSENEKKVVFGHTPSKERKMYTTLDGSICIDSGCVFDGNLCAMIINGGNYDFVYQCKSELD